MARTNNYYWWTPDKWCDLLIKAEYTSPVANSEMMKHMTHHERRLFIRTLLKDERVAAALKCIT